MQKCAIRISHKENKFHIHKTVVKLLGRPERIQLLINQDRKVLFIRGCGKIQRDGFSVPSDLFLKPHCEFCIIGKTFVDALRVLMGWEENAAYRVPGEFSKELNAVAFDLNKWERLS